MALEGIIDRYVVFNRIKVPKLTNNHIYFLAGFTLITLYLIQLLLNLRWEWLDNLQRDEVYRQLTGFLLFAYVLMQGRLGLKRLRKPDTSFSALFYSHKIQGVFGPVVFYIHSIDAGFAYQLILTFVFLGNCVVGYISPQAIPIKNKLYVLSWTVLHVGLAIMTFILMFFHMFIVYYYS